MGVLKNNENWKSTNEIKNDNFEAIVPSDTSMVEKKFISLEQYFQFMKSKFYNNV